MPLKQYDFRLPKAQFRVLPATTPEAVHVPVIGVTQFALFARSCAELPEVLATQIASFSCGERRHRQHFTTRTTPALTVDVWNWFQLVTAFMMAICSIHAHRSLGPCRRHRRCHFCSDLCSGHKYCRSRQSGTSVPSSLHLHRPPSISIDHHFLREQEKSHYFRIYKTPAKCSQNDHPETTTGRPCTAVL